MRTENVFVINGILETIKCKVSLVNLVKNKRIQRKLGICSKGIPMTCKNMLSVGRARISKGVVT